MSTLHRVIDANANRAREALRVLEDAARFHVDDAELTEALKRIRHDLRAALHQLPAGILDANREVESDVGTAISVPGELTRSTYADVVAAAAARLSEALRSIEEACKVLDSGLSQRIEPLRYRGYAAAQRLLTTVHGGRARQWRVCVLITESLCRLPWMSVVRSALAAGAECLQIREKAIDGGELRDRVRRVLDVAAEYGATVIVNDRIDVALAAGAHGVHLGQGDLSIADARRLAGHSLLVGVSTHTLEEARRAVREGADYCGVGMMFPSTLKQELDASGVEYLSSFVAEFSTMPHLAIGGITPENISRISGAGGRGVAVSSCVCSASNPGDVVTDLRKQLEAGTLPANLPRIASP